MCCLRQCLPLVAVIVSLSSVASIAVAQMGPASVVVAPVEKRAVEITQPLVATVEAVTRTTLAAEQEGVIDERMFDEGDSVEKGKVLTRNDIDLLKVQLEESKADREAAAGWQAQAKAEADFARRELHRISGLKETGVATDKEFRDATTRNEVTQAMLSTRAAELLSKKAEVERLELMIRKSEIKSPIAGVVAKRYVEVGQWVKQGDPIADLVQLDPLFVRVNVPEGAIARVKKGDSAQVVFDAINGLKLTGKVDQILPLADAASRTFPVKILMPNPELTIRPGFFGRAVMTSSSEAAQLIVPRDAIATRGTQAHVVAVREGVAVIVPVTRGAAATGNAVVVTGELTETDVVVTRGNEALHGGEQLMVQNANAAAAPGSAPAPASQPVQGG